MSDQYSKHRTLFFVFARTFAGGAGGRCAAALLAACLLSPWSAQAAEAAGQATDSADIPPPARFVTQHEGRFNGRKLRYTARAGETYLRDEKEQPRAAIFSFDYLVEGPGSENRPVTFIWNGGPGSPSLWLHMGSLGPKRVVVPSNAEHAGAPPYPVVPAPETLLDVSDLVFVDPVGTGYSRALGDHDGREFWGLKEDAESMAEFIRRWLTENGRWNSPRFLLGESFGTTRAAAVAELLEDQYQVTLNGLVLVSQALNYAGSTPYVHNNLISHITYLPTMAAAAYYHRRVDAAGMSLEDWVDAAREFATAELLPALWRGNTLDEDSRTRVRSGLARFTGLSEDYIERANLRVEGNRFARELLRDEGRALGRNDARYVMDPVDDLTAVEDSDASSNAISGAYKAGLLSYLRDDLGVDWQRSYLSPADPRLSEEWNWNPQGRDKNWEPHWVDTTPSLVKALEVNPTLNVLVAAGYYDLVTPFFDAEYTLNRYGIPRGRIDYRYYEGGHMMYLNDEARKKFLIDVREFMQRQLR
jgi:carboxypeptidase C (cathepsin A)